MTSFWKKECYCARWATSYIYCRLTRSRLMNSTLFTTSLRKPWKGCQAGKVVATRNKENLLIRGRGEERKFGFQRLQLQSCGSESAR